MFRLKASVQRKAAKLIVYATPQSAVLAVHSTCSPQYVQRSVQQRPATTASSATNFFWDLFA